MKQNTFKISFVLRRNHVNKKRMHAVIVRVTVNGECERITSMLDIKQEL